MYTATAAKAAGKGLQGLSHAAAAADSDGFFHTGDVGELTAAGTLKVVDRIKNMFKLAQGEYIAAEHLENKYTCVRCPAPAWQIKRASCAASP